MPKWWWKLTNVVDPELLTGEFFFFYVGTYCTLHCFIRHPSDSTVSEDAGIEHRTVATLALAVRRSNNSARSYLLGYSSRSHLYYSGLRSCFPGHSGWGSGSYCKTQPKTQIPNWPILSVPYIRGLKTCKTIFKEWCTVCNQKRIWPLRSKIFAILNRFLCHKGRILNGFKISDPTGSGSTNCS